jgi:hypothetical protein
VIATKKRRHKKARPPENGERKHCKMKAKAMYGLQISMHGALVKLTYLRVGRLD